MFAYLKRRFQPKKYLIRDSEFEAVAKARRLSEKYVDRFGSGLMFYAIQSGSLKMVQLVHAKGIPAYQENRFTNTLTCTYFRFLQSKKYKKRSEEFTEILKFLYLNCNEEQKEIVLKDLIEFDMMCSNKLTALELLDVEVDRVVAGYVIDMLHLSNVNTVGKYAFVFNKGYTPLNSGHPSEAKQCLYHAALSGNWSFLEHCLDLCSELTVEQRAPYLQPDKHGHNLLHMITDASVKCPTVIHIIDKYLQLYPVALQQQDCRGETPLHTVIKGNNKFLMRAYMKRSGYNVLLDLKGKKPYDYCARDQGDLDDYRDESCSEVSFNKYRMRYQPETVPAIVFIRMYRQYHEGSLSSSPNPDQRAQTEPSQSARRMLTYL